MKKLDDSTPGKISVWAGNSPKSFENFNIYFTGLENPESGCGIHRDFGCNFIDTDLFGTFLTANLEPVPVEQLCQEIPCNHMQTEKAIMAQCKKIGIHSGNAVSYYCNATFTETDPAFRYNDMAFIGTFDDP